VLWDGVTEHRSRIEAESHVGGASSEGQMTMVQEDAAAETALVSRIKADSVGECVV